MAKIRAPDGWAIIYWKDSTKKKWVNTIPSSQLTITKMRILDKGGKILKIIK